MCLRLQEAQRFTTLWTECCSSASSASILQEDENVSPTGARDARNSFEDAKYAGKEAAALCLSVAGVNFPISGKDTERGRNSNRKS